MKVIATITALALMAGTTYATDQQTCQKKNGNVPKAIEKFCNNVHGTVVPSAWGDKGCHVGGGGDKDTHVKIEAECTPPQWIPQKYCKSQLYSMCVAGGKRGNFGERYYGRNGCQIWTLDVGPSFGHF